MTGLFEFDVLTPSGPCENMPGRYEFPYRLTPRIPSNDNPPILLPASRSAALNLEPPYCIAFTTNLPSRELGTLFAAMDPPFIGPIVTSLRISSNVVKFASGGEEVSFFPPDGAASFVQSAIEYIHLQLCITDNQAQLYINCDPQPLTESFSSEQRLENALMTFFQNAPIGGDTFSVCQLPCNTHTLSLIMIMGLHLSPCLGPTYIVIWKTRYIIIIGNMIVAVISEGFATL